MFTVHVYSEYTVSYVTVLRTKALNTHTLMVNTNTHIIHVEMKKYFVLFGNVRKE